MDGIIIAGQIDELQARLEQDPDSIWVQDMDQRSLLYLAAKHDRPEMVRILREIDPNAGIRNNFKSEYAYHRRGWTPLHIASKKGHLEVTKEIIAIGGKSVPDEFGNHPIHLAARMGQFEMVKFWVDVDPMLIDLEHRDETSVVAAPLAMAAVGGWIEIARFLLQRGSKAIDSLDRWKRTPLMGAVFNNDYPMVELLLQSGSQSIDWICGSNVEALYASVNLLENSTEMTHLLIAAGASINDSEGKWWREEYRPSEEIIHTLRFRIYFQPSLVKRLLIHT